jgi:hypothetical protein
VIGPLRRLAAKLPAISSWGGDPNRRGQAYAITLLTPVAHGETERLKHALKQLPTGERSPLARLPHLHFGRWVVVDGLKTGWQGAPKWPTKLRSDYLLFTADLVVPWAEIPSLPGVFYTDLVEHVPVSAVWGCCVGYPEDPGELPGYLAKGRIDAALYFAGHEAATLAQIRDAVAARDGLVAFVRRHQTTEPEELKADYLEEAAAWRS